MSQGEESTSGSSFGHARVHPPSLLLCEVWSFFQSERNNDTEPRWQPLHGTFSNGLLAGKRVKELADANREHWFMVKHVDWHTMQAPSRDADHVEWASRPVPYRTDPYGASS